MLQHHGGGADSRLAVVVSTRRRLSVDAWPRATATPTPRQPREPNTEHRVIFLISSFNYVVGPLRPILIPHWTPGLAGTPLVASRQVFKANFSGGFMKSFMTLNIIKFAGVARRGKVGVS